MLPFFDVGALSETLVRAMRHPSMFGGMGQAARKRALEGFDQSRGTAGWLALIDEVMGG